VERSYLSTNLLIAPETAEGRAKQYKRAPRPSEDEFYIHTYVHTYIHACIRAYMHHYHDWLLTELFQTSIGLILNVLNSEM